MKIRREQVEALAQPVRQQFEDRMVEYLRRFFPRASEELGEPALRAGIREGARLAATHGIDVASDVCLFVDVMFTHGPAFDVEEPWARRVLGRQATSSPDTRALELFRASMSQRRAASRRLARAAS